MRHAQTEAVRQGMRCVELADVVAVPHQLLSGRQRGLVELVSARHRLGEGKHCAVIQPLDAHAGVVREASGKGAGHANRLGPNAYARARTKLVKFHFSFLGCFECLSLEERCSPRNLAVAPEFKLVQQCISIKQVIKLLRSSIEHPWSVSVIRSTQPFWNSAINNLQD